MDAEVAFDRLIHHMGCRVAVDYKDVGAYRLDWNAVYGGGNIERIVTDTGGVTQPFGMMRRNAKEFCVSARFAMDAIDELKRMRPAEAA